MINVTATSQALGRVLCEVEKGVSYVYVVPTVEDIPAAMTRAGALSTPRKVAGRSLTYRGAVLWFAALSHGAERTLCGWGGQVAFDPEVSGQGGPKELAQWEGMALVRAARVAREERRTS